MSKKSALNIPGIYLIGNLSTGTVYVGQAVNIRRRWETHRSGLAAGTHYNLYLSRAWAKYGSDAFVFEVYIDLSGVPRQELKDALDAAEIATVQEFPDNYNLMLAGISSGVASQKTREVWSEQRKAMWSNPDFRKDRIAATKALYADPEWKAKHTAAVTAGLRKPSAKTRASEHFIRLWQSDEHRETQAAKRKENWQDPDYRARQSISRSIAWADPEAKRIRSAAVAHGCAAGWANATPEARQRRVEAIRAAVARREAKRKGLAPS